MKVNKIEVDIFNKALKETMDYMGLKGVVLAEKSGRSCNSISRIRNGRDFPSIRDFVILLELAEQEREGFLSEFMARLTGKVRKLTFSPEEYVNSLNSSELGALMIAAGSRLCEKGESLHQESRQFERLAS